MNDWLLFAVILLLVIRGAWLEWQLRQACRDLDDYVALLERAARVIQTQKKQVETRGWNFVEVSMGPMHWDSFITQNQGVFSRN